ncbi:hypothetical protein [Kitasatospora sp. NPDC059827]|uniref:hypothetical protein n=1 Tax=Kitasatospora sp. NPDC059827 TaxID=3346964 RepID=UPI003656849A
MTVPAEVREHWRQARANARGDGLVPALTLLSRALSPGAPPRGPRGHAVVPRELLDGYRESTPDPASAPVPAPAPGLAVLPPATTTASDPTPAGADPHTWATGLAWLRLGASERLREACVAHLAARTVEGTSLLLQQLVKGALADALIEQLEIAGVLDDLAGDPHEAEAHPLGTHPLGTHPLDARALARLQAQITEVDRALLRLLGAHGFTADGPGRDAHASELLADAYCGWPGPAAPHPSEFHPSEPHLSEHHPSEPHLSEHHPSEHHLSEHHPSEHHLSEPHPSEDEGPHGPARDTAGRTP